MNHWAGVDDLQAMTGPNRVVVPPQRRNTASPLLARHFAEDPVTDLSLA